MENADIVIRAGTIIDGSSSEAYVSDIAIKGDKIVALGEKLPKGANKIDATGLLVTPGFIDVHAHLDGNVTWESRLKPASGHGITSAIMGNCGVGFAPCKPEHRGFNVALMEGVEDIPAQQLNAGLPWSWRSFPDYLDFIADKQYDMNVAALVPHSCLRTFIMGDRAINGEVATQKDCHETEALVAEAIAAGAVGVGSTRLLGQKTLSGIPAPSLGARETEYLAIARGLGEKGVLQIAPEFNQYPRATEELDMILNVARQTGVKVTYSLKQTDEFPEGWRELLDKTIKANEEGLDIRPQVLARPTGAILSWEANSQPFSRCVAYREIADLPLAARLKELSIASRRDAIVEQAEQRPGGFARYFPRMFSAINHLNYEPKERDSVVFESERLGISIQALLFERFMGNDGRGIVLLASGNYSQFSLGPAMEMVSYEKSLPGLGDAGAHSTVICDASATTHLISYWTRDRPGEQLPLADIVGKLTSSPAAFFGLNKRGSIKPGYFADLNIIDLETIGLRLPQMQYDLPANGRRLTQKASGYRATIVAGQLVVLNDVPTAELPGVLLRN